EAEGLRTRPSAAAPPVGARVELQHDGSGIGDQRFRHSNLQEINCRSSTIGRRRRPSEETTPGPRRVTSSQIPGEGTALTPRTPLLRPRPVVDGRSIARRRRYGDATTVDEG